MFSEGGDVWELAGVRVGDIPVRGDPWAGWEEARQRKGAQGRGTGQRHTHRSWKTRWSCIQLQWSCLQPLNFAWVLMLHLNKQIVTNILGRGGVRTLVFQEICRALLFLHTGPVMALKYHPEIWRDHSTMMPHAGQFLWGQGNSGRGEQLATLGRVAGRDRDSSSAHLDPPPLFAQLQSGIFWLCPREQMQ